MPVEGFEEVNAKFKAAMRDIGISRTQRFIKETLVAIKAESDVMVPVGTTGNLRNSSFNKVWQVTSGWNGEIGYGGGKAAYGRYVHNASGKLKGTPRPNGNGNYWDPSGEPQFLTKAVKSVMSSTIHTIIQQQYKI